MKLTVENCVVLHHKTLKTFTDLRYIVVQYTHLSCREGLEQRNKVCQHRVCSVTRKTKSLGINIEKIRRSTYEINLLQSVCVYNIICEKAAIKILAHINKKSKSQTIWGFKLMFTSFAPLDNKTLFCHHIGCS